MNLIKAAVVAGIVAAAAPAAALADGLSYSYVDLGWVQTDIDGVGPKADGFALGGSIGFADSFFGFADYSDQSVSGVDIKQYSIGFGGHWGLSDNVDLVGKLGWAGLEAGFGPFSIDDDGILASVGLRGRIGENFELEGNVIHTDFGSSGGSDTGLAVGGRWYFTDNVAAGLEFSQSDDVSSIEVGVRFSF